MRVRILLSISFWAISALAFSQHRHDAIILELGGQGLYYSLNFERQGETGIVGRIGAAWYPEQLLIPLSVGKVFGSRPHHFEAGLGITPRFFNGGPVSSRGEVYTTRTDLFLTGFVGYRYQADEKRIFYRAGIVPVWHFYSSRDEHYGFVPWPGLSIGYRL